VKKEIVVVNLPSFFLSVWDTKECEKEGMMMMFARMGWCCEHHEKSREMGKEGGWIMMKK
jgi:hypothetical protein